MVNQNQKSLQCCQIGDQIRPVFGFGQTGEGHFGAGNVSLGAGQEQVQVGWGPWIIDRLHAIRITKAINRAARTFNDAVQMRASAIGAINLVAGLALAEYLFASGGIGRGIDFIKTWPFSGSFGWSAVAGVNGIGLRYLSAPYTDKDNC